MRPGCLDRRAPSAIVGWVETQLVIVAGTCPSLRCCFELSADNSRNRAFRFEPDQPLHPVRSGTESLIPTRHFTSSSFFRAMFEVLTRSLNSAQTRMDQGHLQSLADGFGKPVSAEAMLLVCLPETHNPQNCSGRCSRQSVRHRSASSAPIPSGASFCVRERNVHK